MNFIKAIDNFGQPIRVDAINGKVNCSNLNIISIEIHGDINHLECSNNKIRKLVVPKCVRVLIAHTNEISEITFEGAPIRISLHENLIEEILLPEGIESATISFNPLLYIHAPQSMKSLSIVGCEWLRCITIDGMSSMRLDDVMYTKSVACIEEVKDVIERLHKPVTMRRSLINICATQIIDNDEIDTKDICGDVINCINDVSKMRCNKCCCISFRLETVAESIYPSEIRNGPFQHTLQGIYVLHKLCDKCAYKTQFARFIQLT